MLPYIDYPFQYLSQGTNVSADELKLIASFFLSYPLAGVLKRIPDSKPAYKNLFSVCVSLFYLVGLFDLWSGVRTLIIGAVGTYAIAKYIHGPLMPWIGFVFAMGHLSINQLRRQFVNDPGLVDITGTQMVLVLKLTAFCWNVADGRLPEKDLSEFQRERSIRELPGILDYAGYILFFPSLMIGPAFDYVDYKRWLETTLFEIPPGTDPSKRPPTHKKRKIPRSGIPAAWKALTGVFWLLVFFQFSGWYYTDILTSDEYLNYSFPRRVWILHMYMFTARLKYYGAWALTEGACILSGLGFKGIDITTGKVSWDRLQNVNPWGLETAQNTRAYLANWNINTNNWLRNYIYLRVTPRGKKPGFRASMVTFVTSALWHGFYPGYYLTFILASFIQTVAKNFRRYLRPFFLDSITGKPTRYKICYDVFSYLATQLAFSFLTAPFLLLTVKNCWLVWSRVYFYGIIGTALSSAFFASPAKEFLKKKLEERSARASGKFKRSYSHESMEKQQPLMGLPPESLDEAVNEIREELKIIRGNS